MPDMCVEFENMKRKAEAYDKMDTSSSSSNNNPNTTERTDGSPTTSDPIEAAYQAAADELVVELQYAKETKAAPVDPYVKKAAARKPGRPRK